MPPLEALPPKPPAAAAPNPQGKGRPDILAGKIGQREETQTAFLEIGGMTTPASRAEVAEALRRVRGVLVAEVSADSGEACVVFKKGSLVQEALVSAVSGPGKHTASLQPRECWELSLPPCATPTEAQRARSALLEVRGVVGVTVAESGLQVRGYVPSVTTDKLLEALRKSGCEATVACETLQLSVAGAGGEPAEALRRLSGVPGVRKASEEKGLILLVREKGQAGMPRLQKALEGAGCFLKLEG